MKRKILSILLVSCLLCGCNKQVTKLKDGSEALATFKKEKLSISTNDLYSSLKKKYGAKEIIDLIDTKILTDKYSKKMDEANKEVEKNLESIKQNFKDESGNYNEASLLSALNQYYGYTTIDEFKEALKLNYFRQEETKSYIKKNIKDSEIEDYYKNEIVADREVSHIQIIPDVKDNDTDEVKTNKEKEAENKAKEVIAKLKKGEKFEDLAKEYSSDEDTAKKGGKLGKINKGDFGNEAFDNEVWTLKVGKYSKTPVKTSTGYEIVYVTKEYTKKELKDVKKDIIEKLVDKKLSENQTIQLEAMRNIRKEYGLDIKDEELKESYNKYLDKLIASTNNQK